MSRWVRYGGHLYPSALFEDTAPTPVKPGVCAYCGGSGLRVETIDAERLDEVVPCPMCRRFCKTCGKYRKIDHQCTKGA